MEKNAVPNPAHTNAWNNDAVDYLQQCEEEIRALFEQDATKIDMLNVLENMLVNLSVARKAARGQNDPRDSLEMVGNAFIAMVEEITTYGVDPEDDVVSILNSLQALYVKNISIIHPGGLLHQGEVGRGGLDQAEGRSQGGPFQGLLHTEASQEGEDDGRSKEQDWEEGESFS